MPYAADKLLLMVLFYGPRMPSGYNQLRNSLWYKLLFSAVRAGYALEHSSSYGLSFGEETITENTLLHLRKRVPGLALRPFNKIKEAQTGADWEFWIRGHQQWFSFVVQAKKAKKLRQGVGYDVGYNSGAQIKALATYSKSNRPAIYAFYNQPGLFRGSYIAKKCLQAHGQSLSGRLESISAISLRLAYSWWDNGGNGAKRPYLPAYEAAKQAAPWSCLASCSRFSACATLPSATSLAPTDLGFRVGTRSDDPAYEVAVAVALLERRAWSRAATWKTKEDVPYPELEPWASGVSDSPADYVPRLGGIYGGEGFSVEADADENQFRPRYVVALWGNLAMGRGSDSAERTSSPDFS